MYDPIESTAPERAVEAPIISIDAGSASTNVRTPPHAIGRALRRAILELLRAGPMTAGEITDALERRRPCVSHHLTILREEGRVTVQQNGRYRIYALAANELR